jgi:hypothetical protein
MKNSSISRVVVLLLFVIALSGCTLLQQRTSKLQLDEYQLTGAPELVPLGFKPLQVSQEAVLAKRVSERALIVSNEAFPIDGNPAITSLGENAELKAVVVMATPGQPDQTVRLFRGDELLFEAAAGMPSPVVPVQALWTYDGHWALEILFADESTWAGQIFIDGELVNDKKGYDEAFGLQLLAEKPFFFYMRDGHAGYSYDGKETDLEYTEIPHYRCCAETEINPLPAQNMAAFFAAKNQEWFYVELGAFDK